MRVLLDASCLFAAVLPQHENHAHYDGLIAHCARKGRAAEVLTWNVRHFDAAPGIRAVAPTA